jgi:uncharacterized membrane protein
MTGFFSNAGPSPVEDRLRAALQARAEDFTASGDAWQQLQARNQATASRAAGGGAAGGRTTQRLMRSRFAVPAAAAAAVVIVIVAATTIVHLADSPAADHGGTSGSQASARPTGSPGPAGTHLTAVPDRAEIAMVPPTTAVLSLSLPEDHGSGFFWFGYDSPDFWGYQVSPGLQFCDSVISGGSETSCIPVTALHSAGLASVTAGGAFAGAATGDSGAALTSTVYAGMVTNQVASVTAVLPDGRRYVGETGAAYGFPDKAWIVECSRVNGTRLVFRNVSGRQIADISTTQVEVPAVKQPRSGGVTVLHVAGNATGASGVVLAYLIGGHAAFWLGQPWPVAVSPDTAAGQPAMAGMTDIVPTGSSQYPVLALGYAHANVARIVVHLPHGKQVTVDTFEPGWPGSGLRLWTASLATNLFNGQAGLPAGLPKLTATAYDATGHVLAEVTLGFSNFAI